MTSDQPSIDLSVCTREPIHIPGSIQPHGALLAVRADGVIAQASANAASLFGLGPAGAQGRTVVETLGPEAAAAVAVMTDEGPDADTSWLDHAGPAGMAGWLSVHRRAGGAIVEFEPWQGEAPAPDLDARALADLSDERNLFKLCQKAADLVRAATGYDRVMIYRFHPDWSGEVIGEARRADAVPFRGLRYPATDIPPQARQLYLECRVRVIADVGAAQVPLVPREDPDTGAPLDIGWAQLRSMSPVHVEYLSNMGVGATLTASVEVEGRLWGLIACHHDSRKTAPPPIRAAARTVAEALARRIAAMDAVAARTAEAEAARRAANLVEQAATQPNLAMALLSGDLGIGHYLRADGSAIVAGDAAATAGSAPDVRQLRVIIDAIIARNGAGLYASSAVAADLGLVASQTGTAAGVLALVLSTDPVVAIACFTNELVREVNWGGDPSKPAQVDPVSHRLSPRKSFALWREVVRGTARPWRPLDLAIMRHLEAGLARLVTPETLRAQLADGIRSLLSSARDRQALMREFLDATDEGIVTYLVTERKEGSGHPVIHTVNRRVRNLFELADEFDGPASLADLFARCGLPLSLLDPAAPDVQECEVWTPSRGRLILRVTRHSIMGLETELGRTGATLYALMDITEFRDVEEALRAVRDKALEGERARTAFLAGVSHELRTPLNAIIGFSEMLQTEAFGPLGNPRYLGYVADIADAGKHLLSLVTDILETARLNSGAARLAEKVCDLRQEMAAAIAMLSSQIEAGELAVTLEGPGLPVRADARALRQATLNLLSNAVKFTPAGGRVTCAVGTEATGEAWVEVADTGIGIADEDLPKLFQPFQRAGGGQAAKTPGTGLGLSLVKAIAETHGGRVALTSRLGHGTTVRLILPGWRVEPGGAGVDGRGAEVVG